MKIGDNKCPQCFTFLYIIMQTELIDLLKLKFGRCTNQCLINMFEHFFNDKDNLSLWPENFDKSQVPNDRWTPAEATQILLNNSRLITRRVNKLELQTMGQELKNEVLYVSVSQLL